MQDRCFDGGRSFLPVALCEVAASRIHGLKQNQEFDAGIAYGRHIHPGTAKDGVFELDDPYRQRAQPTDGGPAVSRVPAIMARLHEYRE